MSKLSEIDPNIVEAATLAGRLSTLLERAYSQTDETSSEPAADRRYLDKVIDAHRVTLHALYDYLLEEEALDEFVGLR